MQGKCMNNLYLKNKAFLFKMKTDYGLIFVCFHMILAWIKVFMSEGYKFNIDNLKEIKGER